MASSRNHHKQSDIHLPRRAWEIPSGEENLEKTIGFSLFFASSNLPKLGLVQDPRPPEIPRDPSPRLPETPLDPPRPPPRPTDSGLCWTGNFLESVNIRHTRNRSCLAAVYPRKIATTTPNFSPPPRPTILVNFSTSYGSDG